MYEEEEGSLYLLFHDFFICFFQSPFSDSFNHRFLFFENETDKFLLAPSQAREERVQGGCERGVWGLVEDFDIGIAPELASCCGRLFVSILLLACAIVEEHLYMHMYTSLYIQAYILVYMRACMNACMHKHMHRCARKMRHACADFWCASCPFIPLTLLLSIDMLC